LKGKTLVVGSLLTALVVGLAVAVSSASYAERKNQLAINRASDEAETLRQLETTIFNQQRAIRNYAMGIYSTPISTFELGRSGEVIASLRGNSSNVENMIDELADLDRRKNGFWRRASDPDPNEALILLRSGEADHIVDEMLTKTRQIAHAKRGYVLGLREQNTALHERIQLFFVLIILVALGLLGLLWTQILRSFRLEEVEEMFAAKSKEVDHQQLLIDELSHRVKNTLVTVQSLARQTITAAFKVHELTSAQIEAIEDAYKRFEKRLFALSMAHTLLTQKRWQGVDLREMTLATLSPLIDITRFDCSGPKVEISPNFAFSINLLFHELATNAIKYGALSCPEGYVNLEWEIKGDKLCIEWRECDGPPVVVPTRRGFGSKLIEKGAMREVRGKAQLSFDPDGLVCSIELPVSNKVKIE
jgi:two-component sensor histidine kinase